MRRKIIAAFVFLGTSSTGSSGISATRWETPPSQYSWNQIFPGVPLYDHGGFLLPRQAEDFRGRFADGKIGFGSCG
ncbi:MAG: hypothetical protein PVI72_16680 [Desulfobacterales bacterium]|jgi:hypothetical protein